jgi:hypothetical protein
MRARIAGWADGWAPVLSERSRRALIGLLLVTAVAGMLGGTWDAAWHVTFLRETFWSPPHLLLYTGTTGSLVIGALGIGLAWLAGRRIPLGYLIVASGALVVVGAAPLDEFWHRTFGRDVDVWSFPHLVALGGGITIGLGSVTVVEADRLRTIGPATGHRVVQAVFLAVMLWATMFGLNWYTLVLAVFRDSVKYPLLVCLAATPVLVLAANVLGRGGATAVSALYMAYAAAAHHALAALGYALLPFPPMLLVPAFAIDAISAAAWARRPAETTGPSIGSEGVTNSPSPPRSPLTLTLSPQGEREFGERRLAPMGWGWALLAGLAFAAAFYAGEAASLAWYPHPPLQGPPTGPLAMGYYLERLDRPWDLEHVLLALPFAMAIGAAAALAGRWLAAIEPRDFKVPLAAPGRWLHLPSAGARAPKAHPPAS